MHDDLLDQAVQLAQLDPRRPKQANLRRAVSAAYYSLFHFLVDEACRMIIGAQHHQSAYRHVLGRAFVHGTMKSACTSFSGSTLKASVMKGLPATFAVPLAIRTIALAFVELQDNRHTADYDLTERYSRADVLLTVQQARNAIGGFRSLPASEEKRFFLACLLAWKELSNR